MLIRGRARRAARYQARGWRWSQDLPQAAKRRAAGCQRVVGRMMHKLLCSQACSSWVIIKSPSNPSREKVWGTFPFWLHRPPEKKELVIHRSSSSSSFPHQSQDQPQSLAANYFSIYLLFTKVKIPLALLKKQQIQQKWFWKF